MGYLQFTTGQVLTSTAMNQVGDSLVNVFASSSARASAISSPSEGMITYLSDTNKLEIYTGSAYVSMQEALTSLTTAAAFGTDGSGVDVTFNSATAGDTMLWDASEEKLVITGTNGQNSLEVADGDVSVTDSLTVSGGLIAPLQINAQTGTTYTFVAADAGKLVTSSNGSAQTITIPPNSSVAFAIGTQIIVQNIGSGNATLAQGSGVTIQSKDSNKEIDGQFAAATCIKTATDTWSLIGALK
jgi:hypothetical protein